MIFFLQEQRLFLCQQPTIRHYESPFSVGQLYSDSRFKYGIFGNYFRSLVNLYFFYFTINQQSQNIKYFEYYYYKVNYFYACDGYFKFSSNFKLDDYGNIILLYLIMIYHTTNAGELRFVRNMSRTRNKGTSLKLV